MRRGSRGTAAVEFAIVALPILLLLFGSIEYARQLWIWQALQFAGNQTARCVAIGGTACASPSSYAISTAGGYGATGLLAAGVTITNPTSVAACIPTGGSAVSVQLSLSFSSPAATLIPSINRVLKTTSCYPLAVP